MRILLLLLILPSFLFSQGEYISTFIIEDAMNNADTLVYGHMDDATHLIDFQYDEVDLHGIENNEIIGARLAASNAYGIECIPAYSDWMITDAIEVESKINIYGEVNDAYYATILLKNETLPLNISWDMDLHDGTFNRLTDWHPGLWFDAGCGPVTVLVRMDEQSSVLIEEPTGIQYINEFNDTLSMLFFPVAPIKVSTNEVDNLEINIYPNPTTDIVYLEGLEFDEYVLYDNIGKRLIAGSGKQLDMTDYAAGLYSIIIYRHGEVIGFEKIIKK